MISRGEFPGVESSVPGSSLDDFSVPASMEHALQRGLVAALVNVELASGAALHGSINEYVRTRLSGRTPTVWEQAGHLRVSFALEDESDSSIRRVDHFAKQLGEVLLSHHVDYRTFRVIARADDEFMKHDS